MALSHVVGAFLLVCDAKERIYFDSTKFSPQFFITSPVIFPYARLPSLHCCAINKRSARLWRLPLHTSTGKENLQHSSRGLHAPSEFSKFKTRNIEKGFRNLIAKPFVTPTGFKPVTF